MPRLNRLNFGKDLICERPSSSILLVFFRRFHLINDSAVGLPTDSVIDVGPPSNYFLTNYSFFELRTRACAASACGGAIFEWSPRPQAFFLPFRVYNH